MRIFLTVVLLSLMSLTSYSQGNNIVFIKHDAIYVVKLSCKMGSDKQKEQLKEILLENKSITAVTYSSYEESLIKIICSNTDMESFLLKTFKESGIESFKNIKK